MEFIANFADKRLNYGLSFCWVQDRSIARLILFCLFLSAIVSLCLLQSIRLHGFLEQFPNSVYASRIFSFSIQAFRLIYLVLFYQKTRQKEKQERMEWEITTSLMMMMFNLHERKYNPPVPDLFRLWTVPRRSQATRRKNTEANLTKDTDSGRLRTHC